MSPVDRVILQFGLIEDTLKWYERHSGIFLCYKSSDACRRSGVVHVKKNLLRLNFKPEPHLFCRKPPIFVTLLDQVIVCL